MKIAEEPVSVKACTFKGRWKLEFPTLKFIKGTYQWKDPDILWAII